MVAITGHPLSVSEPGPAKTIAGHTFSVSEPRFCTECGKRWSLVMQARTPDYQGANGYSHKDPTSLRDTVEIDDECKRIEMAVSRAFGWFEKPKATELEEIPCWL